MLIIHRKIGEKVEIVVDGTTTILIEFLEWSEKRHRFRVGVNAPKNCDIYRDNIKRKITTHERKETK